MESSRSLRARLLVVLPLPLALGACCTCPVDPKQEAAESPVNSYLTGPVLAKRALGNVIQIDRPGSSQERGLGLIVGRDSEGLLAVTAAHVVEEVPSDSIAGAATTRSPRLAPSVRIRFCADELADVTAVGVPLRIIDSSVKDIALIKLPASDRFRMETLLLADVAATTKGDEAWVAGREGECTVGGSRGRVDDVASRAQIDEKEKGSARIQVNLPGANESTSGAPLLTGRGIVGVLQVLYGGVTLVGATDIEAIRKAVQAAYPMTWSLERSGNLSPGDPEAARRELSETLNGYLLNVRTNHQTLKRTKLNQGELSSVVASYNRSISKFFEVKSKHDGTLDQYWGENVRKQYQATREALLSVHWVFLALSEEGLVNEMYRTREVPAAVRERMAGLVEPLDRLQASIESVIAVLAAPIERPR